MGSLQDARAAIRETARTAFFLSALRLRSGHVRRTLVEPSVTLTADEAKAFGGSRGPGYGAWIPPTPHGCCRWWNYEAEHPRELRTFPSSHVDRVVSNFTNHRLYGKTAPHSASAWRTRAPLQETRTLRRARNLSQHGRRGSDERSML